MELADSGDYQGDQKEPLDIISLLTLILKHCWVNKLARASVCVTQ